MAAPVSPARRRASRTAIAVAALCIANMASGQYIWIDSKGVRHYSDRAPDLTVPASKILKTPASDAAPAPAAEPVDGDAAAAAGAQNGAQTTAQKNAEFQKRRLAQQEKEKKAGEDAQRKAGQSADCQRMQQYQKALTGGERMALPDNNGERSFLSDEQRAREIEDNARRLADCRKG